MSTKSVNIKHPETHKLAQELARETGLSMTEAVNNALRNELAHVRSRKRRGSMSEDLLAIGRRFSKRVKRPVLSLEELLYDERGLPK